MGLIAAAAATGVLVNQASFAGPLALTNADNIAMISGTTPLLVVGWLVLRNREHFAARVWGGLGLGLAGLVLVVERQEARGRAGRRPRRPGESAELGGVPAVAAHAPGALPPHPGGAGSPRWVR